MIREEIEYIDYNGNAQKFEAYFNISKPELIELQVSEDGGMDNLIKKIIDTKDLRELIKLFKRLLKISYGVKSHDGQRFIKNDEVWAEFEQSPAYEEMFMKLASDADYAEKFVTGVIPNVDEMVARIQAGNRQALAAQA